MIVSSVLEDGITVWTADIHDLNLLKDFVNSAELAFEAFSHKAVGRSPRPADPWDSLDADAHPW